MREEENQRSQKLVPPAACDIYSSQTCLEVTRLGEQVISQSQQEIL